MPPRYAYWTILAGGLPTAFRAADREDLLPTFKRIQQKHPDAVMKYFAKGKLWESKADAYQRERSPRPSDLRDAPRRPGREGSSHGRRPDAAAAEPKRSRDWRPGGEHRDPRQTFKDTKAKRNLERRKRRFVRKKSLGGRKA